MEKKDKFESDMPADKGKPKKIEVKTFCGMYKPGLYEKRGNEAVLEYVEFDRPQIRAYNWESLLAFATTNTNICAIHY